MCLASTRGATTLDRAPMHGGIDDMQDTTEQAYQGWPDRLYLVDVDGAIAFAGGRGPFDFKPNPLEDAIRVELELPPIEHEEEGERRRPRPGTGGGSDAR